MRVNQRDFLDFLPLLFHINKPGLPGYVSKSTPAGICDYTPSNRARLAAKKYLRNFEYKKRALLRYDLVSMFLMGSSGSVAYSNKSDFDVWLCHQHDLEADRLVELQAKATSIEQWAAKEGLEVHFFLMDPVRFKQGEIGGLSSESSGSAQYYLLLEEFYRTSLLLAGRYPIWWLVPPEEEFNYEAYVDRLLKRRLVSDVESVDFGGIPSVPAEEFFGAALWQLFKGIDSPYKSVLKLLLMEVYASEYPRIDLLCLRFKQAVYDNDIDLNRLDPYLMLYQKLEEYLLASDDVERLELVRRCFYFKVNQKLTLAPTTQTDWRSELIRALTGRWGWDGYWLGVLDTRARWRIVRVLKERSVLVRELTHIYRFLSDFARKNAQLVSINQHDLNALGRKLYAAFERKAGKVEIVNRGISDNVWEPMISFCQIRQHGRDNGWAILTEEQIKDVAVNTAALKRSRSLIEAVTWAHFNGVIDSNSVLKIVRSDANLEAVELAALERHLVKHFPRQMVLKTSIEDLSRAVRILKVAIVVNLGVDPVEHHTREGKHLASNRIDAFSYGGMHECLVHTFEQILVTTWKEVITSHHEGMAGMLSCIGAYFQWMPPSKGVMPPVPQVMCFNLAHGFTIKGRIEGLYRDVIDCFYRDENTLLHRYILEVGHTYYVLSLESDALRYQCIESPPALMAYLAQANALFSRVVIDLFALKDTVLPAIFKMNKPGVVQLFFKEEGEQADVYVIDESGALFYENVSFYEAEYLLGRYRAFFDSMLQRQHYQRVDILDDSLDAIRIEYFHLARDRQGKWQPNRCDAGVRLADRGRYNIQVMVEEDANDATPLFTVYCEDREFSSIEFGSDLYVEVARYILQRRQGINNYPIFITDLDLPLSTFGGYSSGRVPSIEFLRYKQEIEDKLNQALTFASK